MRFSVSDPVLVSLTGKGAVLVVRKMSGISMMSFSHVWRRAKTLSSAVMLGMRTLSVTLWKSGRTMPSHTFGVMPRQLAAVWRRNGRTKIHKAVAAPRVYVVVLSIPCGFAALVSLLML